MAVADRTSDSRIAVVMITWNRRDDVLQSLERMVALPEQPKIILVDNGSTDGTVPAVRGRFPRVEVCQAGANLGAAARNIGVRHCDRPYVALSDDDTWWEPGSLRHAADLFDVHPRLAVATARVIVEPTGRLDSVCHEMQDSPLPRHPDMPGPSLMGFLAGASVVRREAFIESGGFPSHIGIGGEEQWMASELADRNWRLCYVSSLVVHHHPSPQRNVSERRSRLIRNAVAFAWLRRPWKSAARSTMAVVRDGPYDRALAKGLAAGIRDALMQWSNRRVVASEVERCLRILEQSKRGRPSAVPAQEECDVVRSRSERDIAAAADVVADL